MNEIYEDPEENEIFPLFSPSHLLQIEKALKYDEKMLLFNPE